MGQFEVAFGEVGVHVVSWRDGYPKLLTLQFDERLFGSEEEALHRGKAGFPFSPVVVLLPGVHEGVGGFERGVDPVGSIVPFCEVVVSQLLFEGFVLAVGWKESNLFLSFKLYLFPSGG